MASIREMRVHYTLDQVVERYIAGDEGLITFVHYLGSKVAESAHIGGGLAAVSEDLKRAALNGGEITGITTDDNLGRAQIAIGILHGLARSAEDIVVLERSQID